MPKQNSFCHTFLLINRATVPQYNDIVKYVRLLGHCGKSMADCTYLISFIMKCRISSSSSIYNDFRDIRHNLFGTLRRRYIRAGVHCNSIYRFKYLPIFFSLFQWLQCFHFGFLISFFSSFSLVYL